MKRSNAPKVKDKAAAGIPIAETLDPNFVQEGSPSLSCVKEDFLNQ